MKTEMDALRMSEEERRWWLEANRVTLMVVGLVWLGMVGYRLWQGEAAGFLIAMVPAFAMVRLLAYQHFKRRARERGAPE